MKFVRIHLNSHTYDKFGHIEEWGRAAIVVEQRDESSARDGNALSRRSSEMLTCRHRSRTEWTVTSLLSCRFLELFEMSAPEALIEEIRLRRELYTALYRARASDPTTFTNGFSNQIFGATLGGARSYGWRVVGITEAALQAYKDPNFTIKAQAATRMERGHLYRRIDTTVMALATPAPMTVEQLVRLFWERDMTVIGVRGENKMVETGQIMLINIPNDDCKLFTGKTVSWQFGPAEKACLRELAAQHL